MIWNNFMRLRGGCALTIATFYGIEDELQASIERSYQQMLAEGLID